MTAFYKCTRLILAWADLRVKILSKGPNHKPQSANSTPPKPVAASSAAAAKTPKPDRELIVRQHELVERVRAYDPNLDEDMLNRAYVLAMKAHGGQWRQNGDPYFTHPIAVAMILTDLRVDPYAIATALLHDTVEDTDVTIEDIEDKFGQEIAALVDGVTKITKLNLQSTDTAQAENFQKFIAAVSKDPRVLLVKLADRLHNMRTLHFVPKPEKRRKKAQETMEIYVPLAGRMGVQKFREELEDLCFRYLNPEGYETIAKKLEKLGQEAVHEVVAFAQDLRQRLQKHDIKAEVYSREKRPFSIWQKMQRKKIAFDELADIYAFRIIVDDVEDCYRALGVIHSAFSMIPGEFDDYISTPKPNDYQSIHTAVLAAMSQAKDKQRVEIQIRSREMHENAERGIAAHWRYKEVSAHSDQNKIELGKVGKVGPYEWLRAAFEMLQHGADPSEFLENAKMELFSDQIFCFTPGGRVIALPNGATTMDFAYAVHTELGDSCVGARINGVTKPLRTMLKNGDVIKVLTSSNAPVPDEWQSIVVTGRAKSAITRRIKKLHHEELIKFGKKLIESELSAHALPHTEQAIENAAPRLGLQNAKAKDIYEAVGKLNLSARKVREAAYPGVVDDDDFKKRRESGQTTFTGQRRPIPLEGLKRGVTVVLSACCSPLPGERIIGLPGDDHQVMVHRMDCDALEETTIPEKDWFDLRWRDELTTAFIARLSLSLNNRRGVLAEVARIFARYDADIINISLRNREVDFTDMVVDIEVIDAKHLANVMAGLRASQNVMQAERRHDIPIEQAPTKTAGDIYQ